MKASIFYRAENTLGEGAIWHPSVNRLLWVDILQSILYEMDLAWTEPKIHRMPSFVSTVVPSGDSSVVVTLVDRVSRYDLNTGRFADLQQIPSASNMRCNDGKCDPYGRLWFGTMKMNAAKEAGVLYSFSEEHGLTIKLHSQTIPNGIVWSCDSQKMYYIDTIDNNVKEYAYDMNTGAITFTRVVIDVPPELGSPDGMAIDREDMLWIAHWGGSAVRRWNPQTGKIIAQINVPAPNVTSCAFGANNYSKLFITTARSGLTSQQLVDYPLSGSIFEYDLHDPKGIASNIFPIQLR